MILFVKIEAGLEVKIIGNDRKAVSMLPPRCGVTGAIVDVLFHATAVDTRMIRSTLAIAYCTSQPCQLLRVCQVLWMAYDEIMTD